MTHEERVYHHLYETNEGIAEQSERIVKLEELVAELYHFADFACDRLPMCECPMFSDEDAAHPCGLTRIYDSIKELEVPL